MRAQRLKSRVRTELSERMGIEVSRTRTPAETLWLAMLAFESVETTDEAHDFVAFCLANHARSTAQLMQDLFVLHMTNGKRDGFFVEFGATDGHYLSNTFLLEKDYGWTGILAEPARVWHDDLVRNRSCVVDRRCVTDVTGESVTFNETSDPELSTIDSLSSTDEHSENRASGERYDVETVSLNDLLTEHHAPSSFDYLSVDTEGSEGLILESLDFTRFRPSIVTVEHNHIVEKRDRIKAVFEKNGYVQRWPELSRWDDWYVSLP